MDHGDTQVEILDRNTRYQGFFQVDEYRLRHSLFAGGWSDTVVRERVERLRAAAVLLYDPDLDRVVLIEQFRIGALEDAGGPWLMEVVGGLVEEDERPQEVAVREAMEEAGCKILDLLPICEFLVSPGTASEHVSLYCGRVDASNAGGIFGLDHEGEDIRALVLSVDDAIGELYRRINSSIPIIALQWLALNRDNLKRHWGGAS